ncbi:hypothetical protein [Demequina oxidasica]|uniref:hypothetical protein n=1 Tax=Demequina oxidasica TaxID=676199 RepID=UPI00078481F8|nr:hypothetical protein [Demequina oxidasica]
MGAEADDLVVADESGTHRSFSEAFVANRRAFQADPSDASLAFRAGINAERAHNYMGAALAYEEALAVPGAPPKYWYFLGRAREQLNDPYRAGSAYRKYANLAARKGRPYFQHDGGLLHYEKALRFGAGAYPAYGHVVLHAALLAAKLGHPKIRVAELGVANGRGLIALEKHARAAKELTGVDVAVFGFDTGEGLPPSENPRDIPYYFASGDYGMDEDALRERMTTAQLILGDAADTFGEWAAADASPVGAILFDMDLYTSTAAVLRLMGDVLDDSQILPRVAMYFDDLVPKKDTERLKDYTEFAGESLAINEFNAANSDIKIGRDTFFSSIPDGQPWHECMFMMHRFNHPQYKGPVREPQPAVRQLSPNR